MIEGMYCYIVLCMETARFQEVLLRRLIDGLVQKEELMPDPKNWVNKEAKKRQALQESGTLR